ncbi:Monocarboxylate transporter 4 [Holothuria leucospilota]|uniref:Monocarboxylate transporter 4 n=1 Tax=Holothuria leucospilota TaxID=206669 RepID=A0A9Q1BP10_HOLLE|nr:Monocarboxylate transporter 4 [Holothuria leucospilota]
MSLVFFDGDVKAFGVILEPVVKQGNLPYRKVGWIFTWQFMVCYTTTPLVSFLISKRLEYRFWMILAGFFVGLGYIGLAICLRATIWSMLFVTSLSGIGHSFIDLITLVCLKEQFNDSFAKAYALSNLGSNLGIAVLPLILGHFQQEYGTQEAIFLFGTFLWNNIIIGFLIKSKNIRSKVEVQKIVIISIDRDRNPTQQRTSKLLTLFEVFHCHKRFIFIYLITILEIVNFVGWAMLMVPYAESVGIASHIAVFLSTICGASGFVGKLLAAIFVYFDHMHPFTVTVIPSIGVAFAYWITFTWNNFAGFALASFLSGFLISFQAAMNVCLVNFEICHAHFKSGMTWLHSSEAVSFVLGGVLPGYVRDVMGDFRHVFELLLLICVLKGAIGIAMCCCTPTDEDKGKCSRT